MPRPPLLRGARHIRSSFFQITKTRTVGSTTQDAVDAVCADVKHVGGLKQIHIPGIVWGSIWNLSEILVHS